MMPIEHIYDDERGTLDPIVYIDPEMQKLELDRVFGRSWLFLGHVSQIPKAGDYVTTTMGEDPVVVVRQKDGSVKAFLNSCRHRAMKLCRADAGTARSFTCSYHGWVYDTGGRLISIPMEESHFKCPVNRDEWSAVQVPRIFDYKGFLFGCWSTDAPSFEEHLSDIAFYIDPLFDGVEGLEVVGGVEKWVVDANWKLGADQFVSDNFHFPTTHASGFQASLLLNPQIGPRARAPTIEDSRHAQSKYGHGIGFSTDVDWQTMRWEVTLGKEVTDYLTGPHRDVLVAKYGEIAGREVGMGHGLIFPNLGFLSTGTLRVFQPRGPHKMEVWNYLMVPKHASPELKARWRMSAVNAFGACGIYEQDDSENWTQIQSMLRGSRVRRNRLNFEMGLRQGTDPKGRFPGTTDAADTDAGTRAFYRRWVELMSKEGGPR